VQPQRAGNLQAAAVVVVAIAESRADGRQARLERRKLPPVVARGQIVQLAADEQLRPAEQRTLEAERVADALRGNLVGEVAGDEGVIEAIVIEDRDTHPEGRHQPVHGREPVFPLAEVGNDLDAARRLPQTDQERTLAVEIHQIECAAPVRQLAAVRKRLWIRSSRPNGPSRRLEQNVERLPRAPPVEDIARTKREFVGKGPRQLFVDALK
jgi:hypothetical protein